MFQESASSQSSSTSILSCRTQLFKHAKSAGINYFPSSTPAAKLCCPLDSTSFFLFCFPVTFFRSLIDFFRSTSSVFGIFSSFIKLLFSGFSSLLFLSGFFFFTDPHRTLFPDLRNIPPIQMCATPVSLFLLESRSYVFGGLYLLFSDYRVNRQVFVGLYLSFLNSPHNLYKI